MSTTDEYKTFKSNCSEALSNINGTSYSKYEDDFTDNYTSRRKTLDGYSGNAFRVGNSNAFSSITDEFYETINNVKKQVSAYLSEAEDAKAKIKSHKEKDDTALAKAEQAYNKKYEAGKACDFKKFSHYDSKGVAVYDRDENYWIGLAKEEKEKVWRANNSDVWSD